MNDLVHPIFRDILNRFAHMSPKEYYSEPLDDPDDNYDTSAWAHQQQLEQQQQDEQEQQP